jgi:hypothetical protein
LGDRDWSSKAPAREGAGERDWRSKQPIPRMRDLPAPRPTPEIDPGVARGALIVLIGGLFILHDRRRRPS